MLFISSFTQLAGRAPTRPAASAAGATQDTGCTSLRAGQGEPHSVSPLRSGGTWGGLHTPRAYPSPENGAAQLAASPLALSIGNPDREMGLGVDKFYLQQLQTSEILVPEVRTRGCCSDHSLLRTSLGRVHQESVLNPADPSLAPLSSAPSLH